jgi:hypothetical protein
LVLRSRDAPARKAWFDPVAGLLEADEEPWHLSDVVDGVYSRKFDELVLCYCEDGRLILRVGGSKVPVDETTIVSLDWHGVGPNRFSAVHAEGSIDFPYRLGPDDIVEADVFMPWDDQEDVDIFLFLHRMGTLPDKLALCRRLWCHRDLSRDEILHTRVDG